MSGWNADLYMQFANERTQPSLDLAGRVKLPRPARIIDLGCGPGNSTAILRQRWPEADITGLDNSPEMIATAAESYPTEKWVEADIATWKADTPFDLVFTNAALHWLPDHAHLFPHLFAQVASGGALAVQMPAHYKSPVHLVAHRVSEAPEWGHMLDDARDAITRESPSFYYDVMQPLASHLDIWETEYNHIMDSPQSIVNWFRATGLRPFLSALETEDQKKRFLEQVLDGYTQAYTPQKDGRILFPFRRLFLIAYRG
jgi:trans-aconitate 2-methyltransferase